MRYYKLMYDYNKSDGSIFLIVDEDSFEFCRYDVELAKEDISWSNNIKIKIDEEEGNRITDYVGNDIHWFIVTEKLKKILEEHNIGNVKFYKIDVEDKNNIMDTNLYVVNICTVVDALNLENSTYSVYKTEKTEMLSVIKYAIDESKVEGYDLFKLENDKIPIFVSERLVKAMKKAKITGCDYGYVTVV